METFFQVDKNRKQGDPSFIYLFDFREIISRPNVLASTAFKSGQFSFACQPFVKYVSY